MDYKKGKYAYYIETYKINGYVYAGRIVKAKVTKKNIAEFPEDTSYEFDNGDERFIVEIYSTAKEAKKALLKELEAGLIEATKRYNYYRDIIVKNILKIAEDE